MRKFFIAIGAALASIGALLLITLGLRSRIRREESNLADQAVRLAERELAHEREAARTAAIEAVKSAKAGAEASIEPVDSEVDREARMGDLGDAIDKLRGGGY